jgi:regulatory protein
MPSDPKHAAIAILARRDHSIREMRQKLKKKEFSEDTITETITWLLQKNLLDDHVFAEKKAESIFRTKLVGPRYIWMKLKGAGVAEETIENVISDIASEDEWNERATQAIVQWKKVNPKHAKDTIRHHRFLASRGFELF